MGKSQVSSRNWSFLLGFLIEKKGHPDFEKHPNEDRSKKTNSMALDTKHREVLANLTVMHPSKVDLMDRQQT